VGSRRNGPRLTTRHDDDDDNDDDVPGAFIKVKVLVLHSIEFISILFLVR